MNFTQLREQDSKIERRAIQIVKQHGTRIAANPQSFYDMAKRTEDKYGSQAMWAFTEGDFTNCEFNCLLWRRIAQFVSTKYDIAA